MTLQTEAATAASAQSTPAAEAAGRLVSLDALRGFDMFWIVGAEDLVHGLNEVGGGEAGGVTGFLAEQLSHVPWAGFHFYDLIFPLFVFLTGVGAVFSLDKIVAREGKRKAYVRVFRRFLLLYFVGILYYGGMSRVWPEMRLVGVLQRIATAYFFASLLYLNLKRRGLIVACTLILVGYWSFMTFVPVPAEPQLTQIDPAWGHGGRSYDEGNNWTNYIDFHYLPGRRHDKQWDPEGLLSSIPAVGSALLGVFAGMLLKDRELDDKRKALYLMGAGALVVAAGYLWGLQFPIVKKLWTSSFVLVAGGYSAMLLGLFHLVIHVGGLRRWAVPFLWIGCNALTAYLAAHFIDFGELADLFVGGHVKQAAGAYGEIGRAHV